MSKLEAQRPPVTIDAGLESWQIVQQDGKGVGQLSMSGRWWTICKRRKPEVRVRVCREGSLDAISRRFDWALAATSINRKVKGDGAGKSGTWKIVLKGVPVGGPYRVETSVGSEEDALEWRRCGEVCHFIGVGDVWLIAGQSNAEGYGRDPVDEPSEIGIHQFDSQGWELAALKQRHHPWLTFAKQLKKELGYPIGLIPTAVGGSAMSEWDPGQRGHLYADMKASVLASGGAIRGVLWYQGESDTHPGCPPKYKTRFARFVGSLRKLVKCPGLPFITVQLNRFLGDDSSDEGWEQIREIQRQISHDLDNVFIIPAFGSMLCDGIHNGSLGNQLIGQRAAGTALGAVYGRDTAYRYPECVSARQKSAKRIELRFDYVVARLDYVTALKNGFPFAIRDRAGDVPVAGYKVIGKNRVSIQLGRALTGKGSVTGAPGRCPPYELPKDIGGYRPMLGFTMEVES